MPAQSFEEQLRDLLHDMEQARAELLGAMEAVPASLWQVAPRGEWAVEAMLRHVVRSELFYAVAVKRLRGQLAEEKVPELARFEDSQRALEALAESRRQLLAALAGVSEDDFYALQPMGFSEESVRSVLENVAMHDREHATQIGKTLAEVEAG